MPPVAKSETPDVYEEYNGTRTEAIIPNAHPSQPFHFYLGSNPSIRQPAKRGSKDKRMKGGLAILFRKTRFRRGGSPAPLRCCKTRARKVITTVYIYRAIIQPRAALPPPPSPRNGAMSEWARDFATTRNTSSWNNETLHETFGSALKASSAAGGHHSATRKNRPLLRKTTPRH